MDVLKFQLTSRREFERLVACDPSTLTDLERAARFIYLQRLAFGGKVAGRSYGVDVYSSAGFNVGRLGPVLEAIHERLSGVSIERLSWPDFIDRYDDPRVLFYLDPPYWGSEGDYGAGVFARADFDRLADRLSRVAGKFIMSLNDVPGTRQAFGRFVIEPVLTRYTIAGGGGSEAVVAHLDPDRRIALFGELALLGAQVWMTGADPAAFSDVGSAGEILDVCDGRIAPSR